jgi:hypothetical protein
VLKTVSAIRTVPSAAPHSADTAGSAVVGNVMVEAAPTSGP